MTYHPKVVRSTGKPVAGELWVCPKCGVIYPSVGTESVAPTHYRKGSHGTQTMIRKSEYVAVTE